MPPAPPARRATPAPPGAAGPAGAKGDTGAPAPPARQGAAGPAGPAGPTGPAGPAGPKGDPGSGGVANVTRVIGEPVPNGSSDEEWLAEAVAVCPDGQTIVSGGFFQNVVSLGEVYYNAPTEENDAWLIAGANWADPEDPDLAEGELLSIAYCVPSPAASKTPYAERKAAALRQVAAIAKSINKRR